MKSKKIVANVLLFVLSVGLGILLAWQMKNLNFIEGMNLFGQSNAKDLRDQIEQLQIKNNELSNRNEELNKNLQEFIELGNDENTQIRYYKEELSRISTYAGLTDVKGPGAIINLDTSQEGSFVDSATLIVIVNALRANGAHGIAINDQRIVALSEISSTGSDNNKKIIVNGTNITSQSGYEIKVIGEVNKLQNFYVFQSKIWTSLQSSGVNVQIHYPTEVYLPALAKDSPSYRQKLLDNLDAK